MFTVIITKDKDELAKEAFRVMKEYLVPGKVLGLATGSSPLGLYKLMIEDHEKNGTSYKDIRTFNLDEYVGLPRTHRESYYRFMHDNLFNYLDIPEENIHVPSGIGEDLDGQCEAYEKMLDENPVDIQLLGLGSDGHIGFNEPGTPFDSITHVGDLTESTIADNQRFFNDLGETTPTKACTMGLASIMKAKKVLIVAYGKNKAEAVKGMLEGPVVESCPASILQRHPDVTVILDEEAAADLTEKH
ncbi:MAG: glucosamine-6-phosphate deaminase [Erysipelotrichaceae bacterium]|nr:glucosamine-6-phosphate deaminase [Erysipelotrichaceae bacterium]